MILSGQSLLETPRWLRAIVVVAAALVLPLGFSLAQNAGDLDRVQEWLDSGINSAFLTEEQAEIMMRALRSADGGHLEFNVDDASGNIFVMKRQVMADGHEVLLDVEFTGADGPNPLAFTERHIAEQLESGSISQAEADALLAEVRNGIWSRASEDGGTIQVYSVRGEPIEVIAAGPERVVSPANGRSGATSTAVVEIKRELDLDASEE